MNRETMKVFNFMVSNPHWIGKIKDIRDKHPNYKDFYNQAGKIIIQILNSEKEFYDYPRHEINVKKIVDMYF